jgi:Flp pilus assembly protein TadG
MRNAFNARLPRRGAVAIEFALCIPILCFVIAGVVDIGMYLSLTQLLSRAARDGARVGASTLEGIAPDGTLIEAAAINQAQLLLNEAGLSCVGCVVADWVTIDATEDIFVEVDYPYVPFFGGFAQISGDATADFTMMTQEQI